MPMGHNSFIAALIACGVIAATSASATPLHRHRRLINDAGTDRPLTVEGRNRGIYRIGDTIVAPGGFSAHGYGYPVATREDRQTLTEESGDGVYDLPIRSGFGRGFVDRRRIDRGSLDDGDIGPGPSPQELGYVLSPDR